MIYTQTVRFADTDAAGVVYFSRVLEFCHAAYEAALVERGIDVGRYFGRNSELAVPITQANISFRRPLYCGDVVAISLRPVRLNESQFVIHYTLQRKDEIVATAATTHIAIQPESRQRCALPAWLVEWFEQFPPEFLP